MKKWIADRVQRIDAAEEYLLERYYNSDDSAVMTRMGEMQDLAFQAILRGDTPGQYYPDDMYLSDSDGSTTIDMELYMEVMTPKPQDHEPTLDKALTSSLNWNSSALDEKTTAGGHLEMNSCQATKPSLSPAVLYALQSGLDWSDEEVQQYLFRPNTDHPGFHEEMLPSYLPENSEDDDNNSDSNSDSDSGSNVPSLQSDSDDDDEQEEWHPEAADFTGYPDDDYPGDLSQMLHTMTVQPTSTSTPSTHQPTSPETIAAAPTSLTKKDGPIVYKHCWPLGTIELDEYTFHPAPDAGPMDPCTFPDDHLSSRHGYEMLEQLIDSNNCELTPGQKARALDFIYANADVFCMTPEDLGKCNRGEHVIDTGDAAPIKQTYYKMPQKKYDQLREHIDYLLKLGLIRPSTSPWSSPAHLVPKPKGEPGATRMVVDYRALNAVSRKDATPLPTVNDVLWNLGPAKFVSCCDLANGYWQLKMSEKHDSIAKSAFATPWGLFEWLVTPFGLTGAPASFVKTLTTLLHDYIGQFVFLYLDDFICYNDSFEAHLQSLGLVFDRLRSANLKINPKKCSLFKQSVTFLGFVLDQTGLHPDPRLLDTIRKRGPPRNVKQTLSFLGLCGYFRRFVQGFAQIAEPLHRLTRKETPWHWGSEQQAAFTTLKDRLLDYPVLRRIDPNKRLYVYCDGSTSGIGACICQRESDDESGPEYVVAWHSRKLDKHQAQWPITDIEAFAVVDACCNVFKPLLYGRDFCVVTDHNALLFLLTAKGLSGRVLRWSLKLMELMPFSLRYCKGVANKVADALSRDPGF